MTFSNYSYNTFYNAFSFKNTKFKYVIIGLIEIIPDGRGLTELEQYGLDQNTSN